jgi:hypothetical protein
MENTTVQLSKERNRKLDIITVKSGETKTELIGRYIDALYQLCEETKESSKISLTDFHIDLLHSTLSQQKAELYDLNELPDFIQNYYALEKYLEDGEAKTRFYTKEELLSKGFNSEDIDILLAEQKKRFEKKVQK